MLPEFRNDRNLENFYNMMDNFFNDKKTTFNIDVKENDDNYTVFAELPGLKKENIELDFKNDILKIKVINNVVNEEKNENYIRKEINNYNMTRSIRLINVDNDNIEASYEDGILKINLAKSKESKTTKIEIK